MIESKVQTITEAEAQRTAVYQAKTEAARGFLNSTLQELIDEAHARLNVDAIYSDPSHQFKVSGNKHRGGCPFHQSSSKNSFVVDAVTKLFWCEGCQFGGNAIEYVHSLKIGRWEKKLRGAVFIEAVKAFLELAGMSLPPLERTPQEIEKARFWESRRTILNAVIEYGQEVLWSERGIAARKYLTEERGFSEDDIRNLGLGLYHSQAEFKQILIGRGANLDDAEKACVLWRKLEGYILLPWLDSRGRPLTIYGRYSTKVAPGGKPKTIALKGDDTKGSPLLFDRVVKAGHKEIVLVEGVFDAALLQVKGDTRVAAYVAASCSGKQIETLKKHGITRVTLCGDPDAGGENGTHSNLRRISEAGISVFVAPKLPDGLDPDEFLVREGMDGWKRHIENAVHGYTYKAWSIINAATGGGELTDKIKQLILEQAFVFAKTISTPKDKVALQTFFWSVISEALGMDYEQVREQLESTYQSVNADTNTDSDTQANDEKTNKKKKKKKRPQVATVVSQMSEKYRAKLAWHTGLKLWFQYGAKLDGIWAELPEETVWSLVRAHLECIEEIAGEYTFAYVSSVVNLLKADLQVSDWSQATRLIPLLDGVLDLSSRKLLPHAPDYRFLWGLPYKWADRGVGCQPVQDWMVEAMKGDRTQVEVLRAYLNAVVCGRLDLQRYLEAIGPGGTGKGTYTRLAQSLVGIENTTVTTLEQLEKNRFETAGIYGKRLLLITDSERYGGEVSTLKAITGGDMVRYERKNVQQTKGFMPTCSVIVASNEPIQSSDYTSGLERRRLTIPFIHQIKAHERRDLDTEFMPYLPGLLAWVLEIPDEQVTELVRNTRVTSLARWKAEMLLDTNPMAEWLDSYLIHDPDARTYIGVARREKSSESPHAYQFIQTWLYANYCEHSAATGSKAVSGRRFSILLNDLCINQLKLGGIKKGRDERGAYFEGLAIRRDGWHDTNPRPITGKYEEKAKYQDIAREESAVPGEAGAAAIAPLSPLLPGPIPDGKLTVPDGKLTAETQCLTELTEMTELSEQIPYEANSFSPAMSESSSPNSGEVIANNPSNPTVPSGQGFPAISLPSAAPVNPSAAVALAPALEVGNWVAGAHSIRNDYHWIGEIKDTYPAAGMAVVEWQLGKKIPTGNSAVKIADLRRLPR